METFGNVILLKRGKGAPPFNAAEQAISGSPDPREEATLVEKAARTVAEMEELWEENHNNVELRDKFHLLRYFLARLPRTLSTESAPK